MLYSDEIATAGRCTRQWDLAMTLAAGEVFASYAIVRLLGAGGMGRGLPRTTPRLPRREALKILLADISNDESFRQRFIRDADSRPGSFSPNTPSNASRRWWNGRGLSGPASGPAIHSPSSLALAAANSSSFSRPWLLSSPSPVSFSSRSSPSACRGTAACED